LPELHLPVAREAFYDRRMADPCTRRLHPGEILEVESGMRVMCCAGVVAIAGRVLRAGESLTIESCSRVRALEGMRDEWLGDSGVAVVFVSTAAAGPPAQTAPRSS
jgi:hypothetical protein